MEVLIMETSINLTIDTNNLQERNYVDYFYDLMLGLLHPKDFNCNHVMYDLAKTYKGNEGLSNPSNYGILLFSTEHPSSDFVMIGDSVEGMAYASEATADTNALLGTLNQSECVDLKNDSQTIIGKRLVWDFPTGTANYEIKSIGFVNNYFKKASSLPTAHRAIWTNTVNLQKKEENYHLVSNSTPATPMIYSYDCNGFLMYVKDGLIKRRNRTNVIVADNSFSIDEGLDESHEVSGFCVTHKVLHLKNDTYRCLATSEASDYYHLLVLDESFNVTQQTELTGLSKSSETFLDWGLCGDYLLLNYHLYLTSSLYKSYRLTTHQLNTITSSVGVDSANSSSNSFCQKSINTYEDINGRFVADISRQTTSTSTSSSYHSGRYTALSQNEEGELVYDRFTRTSSTSYCIPIYNIGTTPLCVYVSGNSGEYQHISLDFAPRTCFKMYRLDTPITKTEANTLKVTVDLVWGE